MSTFMRLSAAAASIILISVVLGFELGAAAQADNDNKNEFSNLPEVVSPGADSLKNIKTRSIAGFQTASIRTRSAWSSAYPAANPVGPVAGNVRMAVPRLRSIPPACLMAMN
jgi:hypothetical protein